MQLVTRGSAFLSFSSALVPSSSTELCSISIIWRGMGEREGRVRRNRGERDGGEREGREGRESEEK